MNHKLFISAPIVAFALFLQIFIGDASGIWFNFALAALIASAFFVDFVELFVLILSSVFVLNWQPAFSFELLLFAVLPFTVFLLRGKIPFSPRLANIFAIFAGLLIVYLSFGAILLFSDPAVFLWDAALSVATGAVVFQAMRISTSGHI